MIRKWLSEILADLRYRDVPDALPVVKPNRNPTQRGFLSPQSVEWLDVNIRNFKKYREQAEAARGKA